MATLACNVTMLETSLLLFHGGGHTPILALLAAPQGCSSLSNGQREMKKLGCVQESQQNPN